MLNTIKKDCLIKGNPFCFTSSQSPTGMSWVFDSVENVIDEVDDPSHPNRRLG